VSGWAGSCARVDIDVVSRRLVGVTGRVVVPRSPALAGTDADENLRARSCSPGPSAQRDGGRGWHSG